MPAAVLSFPPQTQAAAPGSLPPTMQGKVYADFRRDDLYFTSLFDLVLTLYKIPFVHRAVADLRDDLRVGYRIK